VLANNPPHILHEINKLLRDLLLKIQLQTITKRIKPVFIPRADFRFLRPVKRVEDADTLLHGDLVQLAAEIDARIACDGLVGKHLAHDAHVGRDLDHLDAHAQDEDDAEGGAPGGLAAADLVLEAVEDFGRGLVQEGVHHLFDLAGDEAGGAVALVAELGRVLEAADDFFGGGFGEGDAAGHEVEHGIEH